MTRDPLREPRFGDVFQGHNVAAAWGRPIMYIRPSPEEAGRHRDWDGLDLEYPESGVVTYMPLDDEYVLWEPIA